MVRNLIDYIYTYDNVFSPEQCRHYIALHNKGTQYAGGLYKSILDKSGTIRKSNHEVDEDTKISLDVDLSLEYPEEVTPILKLIAQKVDDYEKSIGISHQLPVTDIEHLVIRKYTKNKGFFSPHTDEACPRGHLRSLTLIFYLNDVERGGELNFPDLDYKIQARQGRLVIFPSTWMYYHGVNKSPTNDRYVLRIFTLGPLERR